MTVQPEDQPKTDQPETEPKFRRRKEARPDEILDAALDLFAEKGFDRTRVEDIASRAGVSKGALYLYFPSKDAVIEALVHRAVGSFVGNMTDHITAWRGDPRPLLTRLVPIFVERVSDPRVLGVPKLIIREAPSHPKLAEMYREQVIGTAFPALTALFSQAVEGGYIRKIDPEMAVRCLIGPFLMHVMLEDVFGIRPSGAVPGDMKFTTLLDTHLSIFFAGLEPDPSPDRSPQKDMSHG
ncbi:transcriptional regulator, TetR family [Celeribacter baekdonensis]|uniref:Transcriptional regulator, TetR family n=1 Tax=Celeribacter baekdonensis TaxID=875171 RepID=A0A1G7IT97_9RHOB|nr:TetR/AcrR family transcriptional regulator [Celeribacter baekdonensis]SDF15897.1 transcriptional regulator, TetR family [Celeribacter baekdonensis]